MPASYLWGVRALTPSLNLSLSQHLLQSLSLAMHPTPLSALISALPVLFAPCSVIGTH